MYRTTRLLALTSLLLVASEFQAQAIDLNTALKNVPESANSIAIVRIQDLVNSPLGKKEEWARKHQTQFMAGSVHIPPSVDFVIRAFEFHPEDTRVSKSYGIAAMKKPVAMSKLAAHEKARVEMIVGHAAVHTNRISYFAELEPGLIGGVTPDYRQDLARWLRDIKSGSVGEMSTYLKDVAAQSGDAQVVLALDFHDLMDPKSWRERITTSIVIADKPGAITLLTDLADDLRGVTLKVRVTDKTTAVVLLDFNTVVSQTAKPFLKPILIDLLSEAGASLDDLEQAEVDAKDKTATITFGLSDPGLRQVMSMVLMPTLSEPAAESGAGNELNTTAPNAGQADIRASRNYYASINQVLDDLEKMAKNGGNYNRSAVWHDTFAKKIDQLSIRGVDPDLLAYGQKVSSSLRGLAVSLRGVPIEVNQLQGSISYTIQYQPGGYYNTNGSIWSSVAYQPEYVNVQTNQAEIRGQQAKAIAAGAKQREQIWQMLTDDGQKIRSKMLEKFGRDFETHG